MTLVGLGVIEVDHRETWPPQRARKNTRRPIRPNPLDSEFHGGVPPPAGDRVRGRRSSQPRINQT